tara:strand:+ start:116 stop:502 length:387 start_codon:yes stop_codon:yes gene_type:complete
MSVVWVNGCFDILHVGHIELFKYASSLGNKLVVGVDTDDRVKTSKGKDRPFNTLKDRVIMLKSIRHVDKVVSFNTDQGLRDEITKSGANIIVVGKEYESKGVIGSDLVEQVAFFDRLGDYSTTKILEK